MMFVMIFVLIFVVCITIEIINVINTFKRNDTPFEWWRFRMYYDNFSTWMSGIILVLALSVVPLSRRNIQMQINSFEAQRATLWAVRSYGAEDYETAASVGKVMEMNDWLADGQWIHSHKMFNWYVPKEIMDVKPIQ